MEAELKRLLAGLRRVHCAVCKRPTVRWRSLAVDKIVRDGIVETIYRDVCSLCYWPAVYEQISGRLED